VAAAELYLLYCDCQPLPLFERNTFITSLANRDPVVLFSILALSLRFSDDSHYPHNMMETIYGFAESARLLVMQSISNGPIELSTLQSLCLLTIVDFTSEPSSLLKFNLLLTSARWQHAKGEYPQ
jgi:hypothetical protein